MPRISRPPKLAPKKQTKERLLISRGNGDGAGPGPGEHAIEVQDIQTCQDIYRASTTLSMSISRSHTLQRVQDLFLNDKYLRENNAMIHLDGQGAE
jgi:hypothetical protein